MNSSRQTFCKFFKRTGVAALVLIFVLTACQRTRQTKEPLQPAEMGAAALHAVHSDKLKGIMNGLNGLALEQLPQELDMASQKQTELQKVAELAAQLNNSVVQIPSLVDELGLSAEDKKVFMTLAKQLRTQAETLDSQAHRGQMRAVEATMQGISGTCIACHTLFRELSPPTPNTNP
jgi:cytochrome c556